MPCILCKKDVKLTERILLEDCAVKDKQFYEANFFTNWEYNYLCRRCYWRDFFRRARGNLIGLALTLFLRFGMVFVASLTAWSFLFKYKYQGPVVFYGPVIFSALATLIFYRYMLKILMAGLALAIFAIVLLYGAVYSDTLSLLPDLGAVVQRERISQGTLPKKSAGNSKTTTATATKRPVRHDPVRESELRKEQARQARINYALKVLERYAPFYVRIKLTHLEKNFTPSLYGFGLLYAILIPWHFLFAPMYRLWRERRKKRSARN